MSALNLFGMMSAGGQFNGPPDLGDNTFTPSQTNIQNQGMIPLQDYMRRVEPDTRLTWTPP